MTHSTAPAQNTANVRKLLGKADALAAKIDMKALAALLNAGDVAGALALAMGASNGK